jgi:hypothetical protein
MEYFVTGYLLPLVQGNYKVCSHMSSFTTKFLSFATKIVIIYFQKNLMCFIKVSHLGAIKQGFLSIVVQALHLIL